jgi:hypothetical protein
MINVLANNQVKPIRASTPKMKKDLDRDALLLTILSATHLPQNGYWSPTSRRA